MLLVESLHIPLSVILLLTENSCSFLHFVSAAVL